MKYITLAFITLVLLTACKKEPSSPTIIGRWYSVTQVYEKYINGTVSTQIDADTDNYLQFNKDGSYENLFNGTIRTGRYTVFNDTLAFENISFGKITKLTLTELSYYFLTFQNPYDSMRMTVNLKR